MAKIKASYSDLKALRDDIVHLQQNSPAFFFFEMPKVQRFLNVNRMQLKVLETREAEFITKYVKHDENAQPVTQEHEKGKEYVFDTPELKQQYIDGVNNFMKLPITMEL